MGLLNPLPIPLRLWSHIAEDFTTRLPPSKGHAVKLTIVDHFSKAAHLVSLPKLPKAVGTGDLLVNDVFRLHGILKDIVFDRGSEFTSRAEQSFCTALGAMVSLSSSYHPRHAPRPCHDAVLPLKTPNHLQFISCLFSNRIFWLVDNGKKTLVQR